ncbi:hypothetical protein VTK26DRAFT_1257 [Humicola hyalothermophila]
MPFLGERKQGQYNAVLLTACSFTCEATSESINPRAKGRTKQKSMQRGIVVVREWAAALRNESKTLHGSGESRKAIL